VNENNIDAVKLMRDIRTELSEKYSNNPDLEKKDLEEIRKKYNIKVKQNTK
jgi:hypothetical protein